MPSPAAMMPTALPTLLAGLTGLKPPGITVTSLALDSRHVEPGALFLACAGQTGHGLDYVDQALAAGAVAVAWDAAMDPQLACPNVQVPGLAEQVGVIADRAFDQPSQSLFVAGVTGTDGKTSCAWLMARALDALGDRCGYLGTLGFGWPEALAPATHTTPDAIGLQRWLAGFVAEQGGAAALEVSSHALDQHRIAGVSLDVAVLTQIGRDHLDYHGSVDAYIAAKRRLFVQPGLSHVVLNADDVIGRAWLAELAELGDAVTPIAYGRHPAAMAQSHYVAIVRVETRVDGLVIDFDTHRGSARLHSRLLGAFNASNLAAVLAMLLVRDVPLDQAITVLANLPTVPGRMERIPGRDEQPLVIVDYAHTPDALDAALAALSVHAERRLLCVFGCGGDRDRGKRPLMAAAAARWASRIWVTDDNPRSESPEAIVADIIAGLVDADYPADDYRVVHDRAAAIAEAVAAGQRGDVVLIAGKGHEDTQQIGDRTLAFDDRQVARDALEAA